MNKRSERLLRMVQVSDCHFPRDPATPYRGQNADRNLASLLPAIRRWQPDLLLLTGDVSEDASPAAYGRASALLSTAGAPVLALPGNHDDPATMRRYFPNGPWSGPLLHRARNWVLALLDSTEPGRISGVLQPGALVDLDQAMRLARAQHALVALHHQPVAVGSPWIDQYPLEQPQSFLQWVNRQERVRCVVWGHVHQDYSSQLGAAMLLGSPSTAANSLPGREKFTADVSGPACRWLELHPDGTIETGILHAAL